MNSEDNKHENALIENRLFSEEELAEMDADIDKLPPSEVWQKIGFHRSVGGFFYSLPFYLLTMILGMAFTGVLYKILYPFPESIGYRTTVLAFFTLFFQLFDLGTANIMNRFIGEHNVKNPKRMLQYIQYFIWYQMITGLIQITTIAAYALYIVPKTELAYGVWIMLIHSTTQYPGMLNIFRSTMDTLQQYNKTAIINFIQSEVFQRTTEIIFVLWGKAWGIANPEYGEILGIAIGATIGYYVDDFIAMAFSAILFKKVVGYYGFSVGDCFHHEFGWDLIKETLTWGVKSGVPPMAWTVESFIALVLWLKYIPQYPTFSALFMFAGGFSAVIGMTLSLGGSISEAYLNGKKKLTQYYLGQSWRYTGMIQFLMITLLSAVLMVLDPTLRAIGLEQYLLSIAFIIPRIIRDFQQPYNNFSSTIITSTGNINFMMFTQTLEALLALLSWYIFLPVLNIPERYGIASIFWLIPCGELPAILTKIILNYFYIHKKILPLKIPIVQTFIVPIFSMFVIYLFGRIFVSFVFYPLMESYGFVVAIIPFFIIFVFFVPFFVYFPITGLLGGWDDGSLEILRRATLISGPGKIFSVPMYKLLKWSSQKSKLHNRFGIDEKQALKEARELMLIRKLKLEGEARNA